MSPLDDADVRRTVIGDAAAEVRPLRVMYGHDFAPPEPPLRPEAITTLTPASVAFSAASILVIIPPVPMLLVGAAPRRLMDASIFLTSGIIRASGCRWGSAV